jgi:cytochrome c553
MARYRNGMCILLAAAAASVAGIALAQSLKPGDELRPLYAMGADIADGKDLAAANCARCHGVDGIGKTKGAPNIAGQRPSYIYLELKAYQAGARANAEMAEKVKFLSDEAIVDVAAYYASLDPAPPPEGAFPEVLDPVAAGKAASTACAKCHGDNGVSHTPGVPNLIGLAPKYLVETMKSYQSEDRKLDEKNAKMKAALSELNDRDLEHIALYYALQKDGLTRAQTPVEAEGVANKDSVSRCVKCHGEDGVGTSPASPSIAGQDWTYMVKALQSYKDGSRDDDVMGPRAKKLDDADMKSLAAYYSGLEPKPVNISKPLTADEWADKCDRCHGPNGNSVHPTVPALAAQRMDYLESVLRDYQTGARQSPEMAAMSGVLSEDDIKGLAAHYAYQKARPVVFVIVPSK